MSTFDQDDYLRARALSLCSGLKYRLSEYVHEFPAGSPSRVITFVQLFLEELEKAIPALPGMDLVPYTLENLSAVLDWLDNAHTAQTPRGLVQLLQKILTSLFSDAELLVAPSTEYNYSVSNATDPLLKLAKGPLPPAAQARLQGALPASFYVVRFPRIERDNILSHAIFGHEFGHPIADKFLDALEQKTEYQQRLQGALKAIQRDPAIAATISAISDPLEKARHLGHLSDLAARLHRRGLEELISDAVAVYLFGPSAAFALFDLLLPDPLDHIPSARNDYPPSRYRLRLIDDLMTKCGFSKVLRDVTLSDSLAHLKAPAIGLLNYLSETAANTTDITRLQSDPIAGPVYDWLAETLEDGVEFAKESTKAAFYSDQALASELPALLERLELDVPPNEMGDWPNTETPDWRSALAASWFFAVRLITSPSNFSDCFQRWVTVNNLALKGIEYIILQESYHAHPSTQGL